MASIGKLLGGGWTAARDHLIEKLGQWVGLPLSPSDWIDQTLCTSIILNSYKLELSADKLEVWFYQPDNPDLGRHTEAEFTAQLVFDFLPFKDAAIRNTMIELAGCKDIPPAGPAAGKKVEWGIEGDLRSHGAMLPVVSTTDAAGIARSDYKVATPEDTPAPERQHVETLSGMVQATAVGLLPSFDKLEVLIRGLRSDKNNPQLGRRPLLLSHYVRQPAYVLRYGAEISQNGYSEEATGPDEYRRVSGSMDIRLASEIRLVGAPNQNLFTGQGPLVYESNCTKRMRTEIGGMSTEGAYCEGVQSYRLSEFHPSTATATLEVTTNADGTLNLILDFYPGDLHETEDGQYVNVSGPCPSGPLITSKSTYALETIKRAHGAFFGDDAVRITNWTPGPAAGARRSSTDRGGAVAKATTQYGDPTTRRGSYVAIWELHLPEG